MAPENVLEAVAWWGSHSFWHRVLHDVTWGYHWRDLNKDHVLLGLFVFMRSTVKLDISLTSASNFLCIERQSMYSTHGQMDKQRDRRTQLASQGRHLHQFFVCFHKDWHDMHVSCIYRNEQKCTMSYSIWGMVQTWHRQSRTAMFLQGWPRCKHFIDRESASRCDCFRLANLKVPHLRSIKFIQNTCLFAGDSTTWVTSTVAIRGIPGNNMKQPFLTMKLWDYTNLAKATVLKWDPIIPILRCFLPQNDHAQPRLKGPGMVLPHLRFRFAQYKSARNIHIPGMNIMCQGAFVGKFAYSFGDG